MMFARLRRGIAALIYPEVLHEAQRIEASAGIGHVGAESGPDQNVISALLALSDAFQAHTVDFHPEVTRVGA